MSRTTYHFNIQCSVLAAAINMNPYKPASEVLEKFWSTHNKASFDRAFEKASTKNVRKVIQNAFDHIPDSRSLCAAGINDAKSCESVSDIQRKTADLLQKVDHQVSVVKEQHDMQRSKELLTKEQDFLLQVQVADMQKAATIIKKEISSSINTAFGTTREGDAIKAYEKANNLSVKIDKSIVRKNYGCFSLTGAVDGFIDDDCVLEIKNRTRRLFKKIPQYEQVQLQAYMHNFGKKKAILLECKKNIDEFAMNSMTLNIDEELWSRILDKTHKFCKLLTDIITDDVRADEYVALDTSERQKYVNKFI